MDEYKLINPSDAYTFLAPDLEVAAALVILVGGGKMAGENLTRTDEPGVPFFIFGGCEQWIERNFGHPKLEEWLNHIKKSRAAECRDAMLSLMIGNRAAYDAKMAEAKTAEEHQAISDEWHDKHRTSISDYRLSAQAWAKRFQDSIDEAAGTSREGQE